MAVVVTALGELGSMIKSIYHGIASIPRFVSEIYDPIGCVEREYGMSMEKLFEYQQVYKMAQKETAKILHDTDKKNKERQLVAIANLRYREREYREYVKTHNKIVEKANFIQSRGPSRFVPAIAICVQLPDDGAAVEEFRAVFEEPEKDDFLSDLLTVEEEEE